MTAFTAFNIAPGRMRGQQPPPARAPVPGARREAANICRWPELADVYSYFWLGGHTDHDDLAGTPTRARWRSAETSFGALFNNANTLVYLGGIKDARWLDDISGLVGQREIVRGSERGRQGVEEREPLHPTREHPRRV